MKQEAKADQAAMEPVRNDGWNHDCGLDGREAVIAAMEPVRNDGWNLADRGDQALVFRAAMEPVRNDGWNLGGGPGDARGFVAAMEPVRNDGWNPKPSAPLVVLEPGLQWSPSGMTGGTHRPWHPVVRGGDRCNGARQE